MNIIEALDISKKTGNSFTRGTGTYSWEEGNYDLCIEDLVANDWRIIVSPERAEKAIYACRKMVEAFDNLFCQCSSNPIKKRLGQAGGHGQDE